MPGDFKSATPKFKVVVDGLAYTLVLMMIALITYGTRLGFDTSDEAWVMSLVDSRRVTYAEPWAYHYVLHPLWNLVGENVITFRLLRVFGYVASAIFLAYAGEKFLRFISSDFPVKTHRAFLTLFAILGASWAWIWAPQTLGYNEVSGFLGVTVAALVLLLVTTNQSAKSKKYLFAIGFILALIAPFKYPSTFALSALVFFLIIGLTSLKGQRLKSLLQVFLGGISTLAFLFLIDLPFRNWLGTIKRLFTDEELQALFAHPIGPLLKTNMIDLLTGIRSTALLSLLPLVILLLLVVKVSNGKQEKYLFIKVLGLAFSGLTVYFFIQTLVLPNLEWHYWVLKSISGFIGMTGLAVFLFVTRGYVKREQLLDTHLAALFIFGTPLTLAFGTNNPILGQVNYSMAPWLWLYAASLALLVVRFPGFITGTVFITYTIIGIVSTVAMVLYGVLVAPYRGNPIQANTTSSSVPELKGILMPPVIANQLDWINEAGRESQFNDRETISIASPGLLFTFNNSSFASPFIIDGWPISYLSVDQACKEIGIAPVILKDASIEFPSSILPALGKCGITSMDQYQLIDQHIGDSGIPDAQIWAPVAN
jgi:hypothetical protein